jgi:DNA-binding NarL/FixJ family response regulator
MSIIRILLVDDFAPWHDAVKLLLKVNPAWQVVSTAADGLEAVGKAQQLQPDLVLLDIGLPGISGIEAAAHILRVSPGSKIIFLTENDCPTVKEAALNTGARSYVRKSDAAYLLLPAIEAVVRGNPGNRTQPLPAQVCKYC